MMNENSDWRESKVVYRDGDQIRVLRGQVVILDDNFVRVRRRDGNYLIAKDAIISIHENENRASEGDGN